MRVIPRALTKTMIVRQKLPVLAAVVRAINAPFLRFYHGPDAIRVCSGNGYADAPQNRLRQSMRFNLFPGRSAIPGAIQAASRSATVHAPRSALGLPESCEQNIGIGGIERDIDRAGLRILIQNFFPSLSAVSRAENAALFVIAERVPERRDERDVWIFRVHDQSANSTRVWKPDKLPGFSGINGFVHAVSADDVAADASFARPHIDDVRIGFGNGKR